MSKATALAIAFGVLCGAGLCYFAMMYREVQRPGKNVEEWGDLFGLEEWEWQHGRAEETSPLTAEVFVTIRTVQLNRAPVTVEEAYHEALETALLSMCNGSSGERRTKRDEHIHRMWKVLKKP